MENAVFSPIFGDINYLVNSLMQLQLMIIIEIEMKIEIEIKYGLELIQGKEVLVMDVQ
jgi:hypothetical protein